MVSRRRVMVVSGNHGLAMPLIMRCSDGKSANSLHTCNEQDSLQAPLEARA
jgi:hypothetical protein